MLNIIFPRHSPWIGEGRKEANCLACTLCLRASISAIKTRLRDSMLRHPQSQLASSECHFLSQGHIMTLARPED